MIIVTQTYFLLYNFFMLNLFYIFLGGAIGSVLRFEISKLFMAYFLGTFVVNFAGCFMLGFFVKKCKSSFLTSGLCGGLTTFSTFSYELIFCLQHKMYTLFAIYLCLSLAGGIIGAYCGVKIGESV